ncbi:MAG TPA: DUF1302 domain-containing protein [Opitutaceae bacterium]
MNNTLSGNIVARIRSGAVYALLALLTTLPAAALTFQFGDISGSFDSTLSAGVSFRLQDRDPALVGLANGGTALSVNTDDGNLNYDKGLFSKVIKGTHDLEVRNPDGNIGAFVRFTYFKDFSNEAPQKRTQFNKVALNRVGYNISLLDAYLAMKFDAGGMPVDLRVGRQVLNWGESTFIPNGIGVINAVDVARLRIPGSELREALKPVPMVSVSIGLNDLTTLEAFYLLASQETDADPRGSYFSTNDFASIGGQAVYLGFGALSDRGALGAVPRGEDVKAKHTGQFGFALRYLAEGLNNTEFGFYFMNLHSRLPALAAYTPSTPINTNLTGPLTQVFIGAGLPPATAAAQAAGLWQLIVLSQTNPGALTPTQLATLQAAQTQAAINGARTIAFLNSAATAHYVVEYPEDMKVFGVSFNTALASSGISLQGELSLKKDVPLAVDDVELLFAALSSINPAFGPNNQIGNFLGQLNTYIPGYRMLDVWQGQVTATKAFGPALGASQWILVAEVGGINVPDLPSKDVLRFEGSGTYTSGSQAAMNGTGNAALAASPLSAFADEFSWGYQVLVRFDYTNVFAGINVSPSLGFAHDVGGNTPAPAGNFLEGRRTTTLGLEFTYQNAWSADLRYVSYSGAGAYNLLSDRDFASFTLKYSF